MSETRPTSPLLIVAAWLIVGIPATWGVYNTALNARKLFVAPPPTAAATQAPPAGVTRP
jgi:hypothetical protein